MKLKTLVEGIELYKNLGCKNVMIEGYFAIIINVIRKGTLINWKLDLVFSRALSICHTFEKIKVNHIYQEGH